MPEEWKTFVARSIVYFNMYLICYQYTKIKRLYIIIVL